MFVKFVTSRYCIGNSNGKNRTKFAHGVVIYKHSDGQMSGAYFLSAVPVLLVSVASMSYAMDLTVDIHFPRDKASIEGVISVTFNVCTAWLS